MKHDIIFFGSIMMFTMVVDALARTNNQNVFLYIALIIVPVLGITKYSYKGVQFYKDKDKAK
jgi:hypothetical protein